MILLLLLKALKKELCHRCFPVNFSKFLRTHFFYRTPPVAAFILQCHSTYRNWCPPVFEKSNSKVLPKVIFSCSAPVCKLCTKPVTSTISYIAHSLITCSIVKIFDCNVFLSKLSSVLTSIAPGLYPFYFLMFKGDRSLEICSNWFNVWSEIWWQSLNGIGFWQKRENQFISWIVGTGVRSDTMHSFLSNNFFVLINARKSWKAKEC